MWPVPESFAAQISSLEMPDSQLASEKSALVSRVEPNPNDYWDALIGARNAEQLCMAWLPILGTTIPAAVGGLLLLKEGDGSFVPAAVWPDDANPDHLRGVAEEALSSRRGAIGRDRAGFTELAYPLVNRDEVFGAVILDLQTIDDEAVSRAMRQLHWGAGWLLDLQNRRELQLLSTRLERSAYLFDLVLEALAEPDFKKFSLAIVNRLAQKFHCHQVQFGIEKGKSVEIEAISHSAWFDGKANLINLAATAMNEAFDQRTQIIHPVAEGGGALIRQAHQRYAEESRSAALCSTPLVAGVKVVGVWLLERDTPFSDDEIESVETIALAMAPIIELKQGRDESLFAHTRRSIERGLGRITDTSYPGIKLVVACAALVLAVLAIVEIEYRVGAPAAIEGAIQRSVVAPFDGYIQAAAAKAGDIVQNGQVLATLEDKDLVLEHERWRAEHEVAQGKALDAMAKGDRVELRQASAQADQALAQLNLVTEKLGRVKVSAPFDGVVVRGDLSQQIGSPVEQGKVLFEVSPLAAWRVVVKVDERDVSHVREGMTGTLMLTSLPSEAYPLVVSKVTPVATAEDGRNYFRVETTLTGATPALRPNMEGVAKIASGQRSVLWIWTHRLTDWLRVALWKLMP